MRVEKSRSKRAACSICGAIIKDDYRVSDWGNRDTLYYHIDCIVATANKIMSAKNLESRIEDSPYKGINVTKL